MRIGIFVVIAGQQGGGPEVYELNLVRNLAEIDDQNEYHVYCLSQKTVDTYDIRQDNVFFHVLKPSIRWVSIPVSLPLSLINNNVDLYHATFTPPPFSPKNFVFTHHCFSTFVHKEFYDPLVLLRLNRLITVGVKKSKLCICVSKNVRDLTAEKFKIPLERMPVVYNGVGENFKPIEKSQCEEILKNKYGIDFPYFLFVGKIQDRKNIIRILDAFHQFRQETKSDWRLVLIGKRKWVLGDMDETVERYRLQDCILEMGYIDNRHLPVFYSGAQTFVFPSLWEGFGIPVVEAMACGTPVITSNTSCLPEVTGGVALLVDPYKVEEIAEAMHKVYTDSALCDILRQEGLIQARQFSWRKTAEQTLEAYKMAAELQD
jgi:glycosyltransferase involved in cell wall biosynthesis